MRAQNAISYDLIKSAASGDTLATMQVIDLLDPMIKKLSTRYAYDGTGKKYTFIDPELYGRLIKRLMLRTLSKRLESVLFSAAAMGTIDSRQSAGEKTGLLQ